MKLLFIGGGKGSWTMRGQQVGRVLDAVVRTQPFADDFVWADVVVLVKRAGAVFAEQARRAGKPIVWDALDFWWQPAQNSLTEAQARDLFAARVAEIQPTLTIGATEAMAAACGGVYIPHQCWPGLRPAPARPEVSVVAYQGEPVYLGQWQALLEAACAKRGWRFVINPPDLRSADILVSLRDGPWDGWMCRQWKSGVKVVNAICAGRPILMQPCAAASELKPYGSIVEDPFQLEAGLDRWTDYAARAAVVTQYETRAGEFTLDNLAHRYRRILREHFGSVAA